MSWHHQKSGFTLVELSIALVIIGLIIGGILVGRQLISAAEIRSLISQKQQFDLAVNTFKMKYDNYLPGDMPPSYAASLGFFELTGTHTSPLAFNNGRVENGTVSEFLVFWRHLSEANLISGSYGINTTPALLANTGRPSINTSNIAAFMPSSKLGGYYLVYYMQDTTPAGTAAPTVNKNTYMLRNVVSIRSNGFSWGSNIISPVNVYTIDSKMDDGKPNSGAVLTDSNNNWAATIASGLCIYGGAAINDPAAQYNIDPAYDSDERGCTLIHTF